MSPPSSPSSLDDAGDKSRRIYSRRHSYQSKIELSHVSIKHFQFKIKIRVLNWKIGCFADGYLILPCLPWIFKQINTYLKEISNQVTLISLEEFFSISPPSLSFHFSPRYSLSSQFLKGLPFLCVYVLYLILSSSFMLSLFVGYTNPV